MSKIKLNNFIVHSDFQMMANDDVGEISLIIPNSFVIPAYGYKEFHKDIKMGRKNASVVAKMWSSKHPDFVSPATSIVIAAKAHQSSPAGQIDYDFYTTVSLKRINPTTIRLQAFFNSGGMPISINITDANQTITARIRTFRDPFEY